MMRRALEAVGRSMGRVVILVLVLVVGVSGWYWRHLQFKDGRGLAYDLSPEYGGYVLMVLWGAITVSVLCVAFRELFPGERDKKGSG